MQKAFGVCMRTIRHSDESLISINSDLLAQYRSFPRVCPSKHTHQTNTWHASTASFLTFYKWNNMCNFICEIISQFERKYLKPVISRVCGEKLVLISSQKWWKTKERKWTDLVGACDERGANEETSDSSNFHFSLMNKLSKVHHSSVAAGH